LHKSRWPMRRVAESRLIPRTAAHLAVTGLLVVSIAAGVAAGARAGEGPGFFDIIAVARGAAGGDSILEAVGSRYDLAPNPEVLPDPAPERRTLAFANEPTPLPTPVAPPPPPRPPVRVFVPAAPVVGTGQLAWPVPGGSISRYYGSGHLGLDIAAPFGSRVVASDDGTVIWAGWRNNGGGLVVAIDHGGGFVTDYNHLGSISVAVGQAVTGGQQVAAVGCTGVCTGPHVHYSVIVDGVIVNPLRYL